jgi:hypothetical protein
MSQANNDILQVLLDMRNGAVAADVNEKFEEMIRAVLETGGKGKLTVELSVEPSKKGMGGVVLEVEARHACKLKKPELPIGSAVFFVSKEGKLTRDDPAQEQMFGGEVKLERRAK